jgi:hypothetical protein
MLKVTSLNDVKVYNCSAGKTTPQWLEDGGNKNSKALRYNQGKKSSASECNFGLFCRLACCNSSSREALFRLAFFSNRKRQVTLINSYSSTKTIAVAWNLYRTSHFLKRRRVSKCLLMGRLLLSLVSTLTKKMLCF